MPMYAPMTQWLLLILYKKDKAEFYSFSLSLTMVLQIKLLSAFFAFTTTIYYQYNIVHTCTSTSRQYKACQLRQFLKKDIDLVDTIYLQSACSFSSLPRKEDRTNWFLKKRGDFENLIKSFARMLLLGNESLFLLVQTLYYQTVTCCLTACFMCLAGKL